MNAREPQGQRAEPDLLLVQPQSYAREDKNGRPARGQLANPEPSGGRYLQEFVYYQTPISMVMSRDVVSVGSDMSVEGLVTLLLKRGLSAVPVIDKDGVLVGIVSMTDILREMKDRGDEQEQIPPPAAGPNGIQTDLRDGSHATRLARATVEEIMTQSVLTLPETASVTQAAALMTFAIVSQLPVVCSRYKVVGMISAIDVMQWLARQSGFLHPPTNKANGR